MKLAIHISHEAEKKIGGIGSVLSGLCNSEVYLSKYDRTLFYGPLFDEVTRKDPQRLGEDATTIFSSLDNNSEHTELKSLCDRMHIDIVYGKKKIFDEIDPTKSTEVEVILVGVKRLKIDLVNRFKYRLWEEYGFQSELYHNWDFEQYIRLAVPLADILNIVAEGFFKGNQKVSAFAHEYMGIPCCLKLLLNENYSQEQENSNLKTYFYAHEVSTARSIVENIPGHDLTFYSLLEKDLSTEDMDMEKRFGSQKDNYRSEMIKLAVHFDNILAVGDWVKMEYLYLVKSLGINCQGVKGSDSSSNDNEYTNKHSNCGSDQTAMQSKIDDDLDSISRKIKIVYNGIPTNSVDFEQKEKARNRLCSYGEALYNFHHDVVFTHVTRLVISKGLWRDIRFLEEMDSYFAANNLKGFYILLSTLIGSGRSAEEVYKMEEEYGWPALHKEGYPDLIDYEKDVYASISVFNAKSKAIKGVFINQYGFTREKTGLRIPPGTDFSDIRYGSDVEIGFSVYEPFGIAQIESVPYGGLAYLSRCCGCSYLLEKSFAGADIDAYHIIDFCSSITSKAPWKNKEKKAALSAEEEDYTRQVMALSTEARVKYESELFKAHGERMYEKIPKNSEDRRKLFEQAKKYAAKLSWDDNVSL